MFSTIIILPLLHTACGLMLTTRYLAFVLLPVLGYNLYAKLVCSFFGKKYKFFKKKEIIFKWLLTVEQRL